MPKNEYEVITLLPDEHGAVCTQGSLGIVSVQEESFPQAVAGMMQAPVVAGPDVLAMRQLVERQLVQGDTAHWRGLVALCLLLDTWKEPVQIHALPITKGTGTLASSILASCGEQTLTLLVLAQGENRALLGLCDSNLLVLPAMQPEHLETMMPSRVRWYQAETNTFTDPCKLLNQRDRRRLMERLMRFPQMGFVADFVRDLHSVDIDRQAPDKLDGAWGVRMMAMLSLSREAGFELLLEKHIEPYRDVRTDCPVLSALGVQEGNRVHHPQQTTWLWRGQPFAWSNDQIGLEMVPGVEDALLLQEMAQEHQLLMENSPRYAADWAERLGSYLQHQQESLTDEAKQKLQSLQAEASQPLVRNAVLELVWPWRQDSPAGYLLLREALGEKLARAASQGLADRLTLLCGGTLCDALMDQVCTVNVAEKNAVAIPPLGVALASCIADGMENSWAAADSIRLTTGEDGAVTASVLLTGQGAVRLHRTYRPEEQERWNEENIPQVALWPSVPLPKDKWKPYFLSVRGRLDIGLPQTDGWKVHKNEEGTTVFTTDTYPKCVSLHRGGLCLGTLISEAPIYHPEDKGEMIGALDIGRSGAAMALRLGNSILPVEIPSLWRMLLGTPQPSLTGERLPVWPLGPVLPANAVRVGEDSGDQVFVDGQVLSEQALDGREERSKANYDLLWRTDEAGMHARRLWLSEAILLTSFHGVMHGATAVRWRVSLPSEVAETGRRTLCEEVEQLIQTISWQTGLPLTDHRVEAVRSCEADALYLRGIGVKQSFALLDLGGGSVNASVWLRGADQPVAGFDLPGLPPLWVQGMAGHGEAVHADFTGLSGCPVSELAIHMEKASMELRSWERSRLLMDHMLGAHLSETAAWMNAKCYEGRMTRLQSLMLLGLAAVMTNVGIILEKLGRNSLLNDHLPEELPLCLCGRGVGWLMTLDPAMQQQLTRFLRLPMGGNHPVRSIRFQTVSNGRRETVEGLLSPVQLPIFEIPGNMPPVASTAGAVKSFLIQFQLSFPQASVCLFPHLYAHNMVLTPAADALVDAICAANHAGTDYEQLIGCLSVLVAR